MAEKQNLRLGVTLWLAAMVGVLVVSLMVIPQLFAATPQPVPVEVAIAVSMLQSGVLLALAVWAGVSLSRPLGMGAPAIQAAVAGSGALSLLKRQLVPAVVGGLLVGFMLVLAPYVAPAAILALSQTVELPVAAKLLYGGITEEVLMRWGLMTVLVWLPWRFLQKRTGLPRKAYVFGAITVAALLFGVGHLPAVAAMGASLTPSVVSFVILANTAPGILFGLLYWRYGLEAAIIAHALAHAVSIVAGVA